MKNILIILLLLCSIKGFSQVPITRTLSNVNNTADSLKPVSKAQTAINTSLQSSINTNLTNIATNTSNLDALSLSNSYIEQKSALAFFEKQLYAWKASPAGKFVSIAWFGDSVSPHVSGQFANGIVAPRNYLNYPSGVNSQISITQTGKISYNGTGLVDQTIFNGKTSATITLSGTTATVTTPVNHGLTTSKYVTISGSNQTEYNGNFLVASVINSTSFTYTITGTPATPATGTITSYGGLTDFTYLPNAAHIQLENAATVLFDAGQTAGIEKFRLFFAKDATSGSVLIELLDEAGTTVISSQSVNLTNATLTATSVDISTVNFDLKRKVRITATGKVIFLNLYSLTNNGIVAVNFGAGGTSLTQNCFASKTILDYIMTTMDVSLMFIQAKEEGLPSSLTTVSNLMNTYPNVSKFVIGSLPDVTTASTQIQNNLYFKSMSTNNGYAYFDGYKAIGSYGKLVSLGWITDGTHPINEANKFCADLIHAQLNINNTENTISNRAIDQRYTSVTDNVLSSLSISSLNPTQKIPVIVNSGGGSPTKVDIFNIRRLAFGASGGSYPYIGGYGSDIAALNQSDQFVRMYARGFNVENGLSSSFNNIIIDGSNVANSIYHQIANTRLSITTNGGIISLKNTLSNTSQFILDGGRMGLGGVASPNASALMELSSTTLGVLLPRMTTTQRDAITTPSEGLEIYNLTTHAKEFFNGTVWKTITTN